MKITKSFPYRRKKEKVQKQLYPELVKRILGPLAPQILQPRRSYLKSIESWRRKRFFHVLAIVQLLRTCRKRGGCLNLHRRLVKAICSYYTHIFLLFFIFNEQQLLLNWFYSSRQENIDFLHKNSLKGFFSIYL